MSVISAKSVQDALLADRNPVPRQQSFIAENKPFPIFESLPGYSHPHPLAGKLQGESIALQIQHILADRAQFLNEHPSRRVMADRCLRVTTCYSDLKVLGFAITDVTVFGLRHAKALLGSWRQKNLSPSTIYKRWSVLRTWSLVLNKHGMLGPLTELWPEFTMDSGAKPGSARTLTDAQVQTRSNWLCERRDRTAYLVDRLCREVQLTREDALGIDRSQALAITKGQPFLTCGQGARTKTYTNVSTHWELFREVLEFLKERNRAVLGWPGLDSHDAIHKYALQLSYAARCLFAKGAEKDGSSKGHQA